jgi:predicted ABC-type transport system involved in lysophospholipase L1 biosynthesis ATPase subunit
MHAIIAKDLSRIVRDADRELAIVDGLSFSVARGCRFCVTGPSGKPIEFAGWPGLTK